MTIGPTLRRTIVGLVIAECSNMSISSPFFAVRGLLDIVVLRLASPPRKVA
jgi:hypothetical protein